MRQINFKTVVFTTLVISFISYSFTLYFTEKEQVEHPSIQAQKGREIWQEKNCISCHQLYGLGGHLGPDLTNVAATRSKEYINAFLTTGTKVMPNFHLSENEKEQLVAFFNYLNTTGVSAPTSFNTHIDGTISQ